MGHTCDRCGETFGTLSRLRLHDCPGVDFDDDERLALLVEGHAYVTEYFPGENGWVVTREEETRDMAKDEAKDTLRKLIQDWQSVVTELSLDYAGGDDGVYDRLRKELNL